jgi:hypothetical protein
MSSTAAKKQVKLPSAFDGKFKLGENVGSRSDVAGRVIFWEQATQNDIDWAVQKKCPHLMEVKAPKLPKLEEEKK